MLSTSLGIDVGSVDLVCQIASTRAVAVAMHLFLTRTRLGLVVRAGVEDREMVQSLGYHIRRVFIGVFMAGTALAGMGGMMWGQYQELVTSQIGDSMTILVFIILIIGGLGSVGGCFIGAILVGLTTNYVGFLAPKLALGSNILLMALILLWQQAGRREDADRGQARAARGRCRETSTKRLDEPDRGRAGSCPTIRRAGSS